VPLSYFYAPIILVRGPLLAFAVAKKLPRENRVPIMMSEEELRAIDEWRASSGVATRSEAIRRLSANGLLLEEMSSDLDTRYGALANAFFEGSGTAMKIIEFAGKDSELSLKAAIQALTDLAEPTAALGETVAYLTLTPAVARRSENFMDMAVTNERMQARSLLRLEQMRAAFADADGETKK